MTDAISTSGEPSGVPSPIDKPKLGATGLLLACILARCVVSLDPFPIDRKSVV